MIQTRFGRWQLISLTVLRMAIGWHFLYEGLIKVTNPDWSAAVYLNTATGPFAGVFQGIAGNTVLLGITDFLNEWGLLAAGLSLLVGLFSRWACLAGMVLLAMYYLAYPPFIGLENTGVSEGNYLIINKNLIELFALWALFLFHDSKVYGLDRFIRRGS